MLESVLASISKAFGDVPVFVIYIMASIVAMLSVYFLVKGLLHSRQNSAHTSFQQGVVAPVQYGDRGKASPEDAFAHRLETMVEKEEAYDLAKLMPKARELGAIAKSNFRTAPVLAEADLGVLALVEEVAQSLNGGFRVLVHASLETLIDLEGQGARNMATKLSLTGVDIKFAVVDRYGRLVVAVEHMGNKPLGRQENINRTVVIEVLRKAGVWYLEIPYNYSEGNAKAQLRAVLRGKSAALGPVSKDTSSDDSEKESGDQVA